MGKFLSIATTGIDEIAKDIGKLATDVTETVGQLTKIVEGFPGLGTEALSKDAFVTNVIFADSNDVTTALKAVMDAANSAARKRFNQEFGPESIAGSDYGVIEGFDPATANLQHLIDQLSLDFDNWGLAVDEEHFEKMAETIKQQVNSQLGAAGTSFGKFYLNLNQKIDWTVAYGMFQITATSNGLVYAFAAGLDSGFGRRDHREIGPS